MLHTFKILNRRSVSKWPPKCSKMGKMWNLQNFESRPMCNLMLPLIVLLAFYFEKALVFLILLPKLWPKSFCLFFYNLVAILKGALYLESLEFWKYAIAFHLFFPYKTGILTQTAFVPHFSVQINGKKVFFNFFRTFGSHFEKHLLYQESP